MKFNMYYIAAFVAVAIIVIVVLTQRSEWDLDRYILSADNSGNLKPIPEKYFKDQEDRIMKLVNDKLKNVVSFNDQIALRNDGALGIDGARKAWLQWEVGGPFQGPMVWRDLKPENMNNPHWKANLKHYTKLRLVRPP